MKSLSLHTCTSISGGAGYTYSITQHLRSDSSGCVALVMREPDALHVIIKDSMDLQSQSGSGEAASFVLPPETQLNFSSNLSSNRTYKLGIEMSECPLNLSIKVGVFSSQN